MVIRMSDIKTVEKFLEIDDIDFLEKNNNGVDRLFFFYIRYNYYFINRLELNSYDFPYEYLKNRFHHIVKHIIDDDNYEFINVFDVYNNVVKSKL
jgi:hypothetical protein